MWHESRTFFSVLNPQYTKQKQRNDQKNYKQIKHKTTTQSVAPIVTRAIIYTLHIALPSVRGITTALSQPSFQQSSIVITVATLIVE